MMRHQLWAAAFIPWSVFWYGPPGAPPAAHPELAKIHQTEVRVSSSDQCADGPRFRVKVVSSLEEMQLGLGKRLRPLAAEEGMLFARSEARPASFWMKDTFIPLAIGFFDEQAKLSSVEEMTVEPDPTNPKIFYDAKGPVLLSLEVAPGGLKSTRAGQSRLCVAAPGAGTVKKKKSAAPLVKPSAPS